MLFMKLVIILPCIGQGVVVPHVSWKFRELVEKLQASLFWSMVVCGWDDEKKETRRT
jgi:hypothetical protein